MQNKSTAKKAKTITVVRASDPDSLVRFADLLKLRGLAATTQEEYLRFVRKLAARHGGDPAVLDEAALRAHLLRLKEEHHYSPSTMRTAVAAMRAFFGLQLGHDWRLFDLVRAPSGHKLPTVLTRAEVARLFSVVREPRFLTLLRLAYACGLRLGDARKVQVSDIRNGCLFIRGGKGNKDRVVPLPATMLAELRAFWRTHRNPRWLFPSPGHRWRERPELRERLSTVDAPLGAGSVQRCMRLARAQAQLPETTTPHTLRHSYATHMLEEGVSIRLISAYLGHASIETTLIYTHLTAVNEASARAAMARLLPPVNPQPVSPHTPLPV